MNEARRRLADDLHARSKEDDESRSDRLERGETLARSVEVATPAGADIHRSTTPYSGCSHTLVLTMSMPRRLASRRGCKGASAGAQPEARRVRPHTSSQGDPAGLEPGRAAHSVSGRLASRRVAGTTHEVANDSWAWRERCRRRRRVGSAAAPSHRCIDCSESGADKRSCPLGLC